MDGDEPHVDEGRNTEAKRGVAREERLADREPRERQPRGDPGPRIAARRRGGRSGHAGEQPQAREGRSAGRRPATRGVRAQLVELDGSVEDHGERHREHRALHRVRARIVDEEPRAQHRGCRDRGDRAGPAHGAGAGHPRGARREDAEHPPERTEVGAEVATEAEVEAEPERQQHRAGPRQLPELALLPVRDGRQRRVDAAEDDQDADAQRQALRPHARADPGDLVDRGEQQAERGEHRPALAARQVDQSAVEHQQVAEEGERVVLPRGKRHRRGEAGHQPEEGNHHRVVPHREQAAGERDQHHQRERQRRGDEPPRVRVPEGRVEDGHARARDPVGEDGVAAPQHQLRGADPPEPDEDPQHHAQPRRDEVVLDRVLEEIEPRDHQHARAHRGGAADADPPFPVEADRSGSRTGRGRCRHRRRGLDVLGARRRRVGASGGRRLAGGIERDDRRDRRGGGGRRRHLEVGHVRHAGGDDRGRGRDGRFSRGDRRRDRRFESGGRRRDRRRGGCEGGFALRHRRFAPAEQRGPRLHGDLLGADVGEPVHGLAEGALQAHHARGSVVQGRLQALLLGLEAPELVGARGARDDGPDERHEERSAAEDDEQKHDRDRFHRSLPRRIGPRKPSVAATRRRK